MSHAWLCDGISSGNLQQVKTEVNKKFIDLTVPFKSSGKSEYYLSYAIRHSNIGIVMYLLENGAIPTIPAAFPVAVEKGDVAIVRLLLSKQQLDVNKICKSTKKTPLSQAIDRNNYNMVNYLLKSAKANPNNGETPSPLARAIPKPDTSILKLLLECGAVINPCENLLSKAIEHKSVAKINLLIQSGAHVGNEERKLIEELAETDDNFELIFENLKITDTDKELDINLNNLD